MPIDLFAPYTIGRLRLPNRFMRSATHDRTAENSGAASDASVAVYERLGRGNIGLIVSGFAFISEAGQMAYGQYGAHDDAMLPGLRQLVKAAHQGDSKIALQIVHTGINIHPTLLREKGLSAMVVSRMPETDKPQREMTEEDIETVISQFVAASVRGRAAGFDAVQFHAAHSYLFCQFLSPLLNRRTDRWGGNPENRRRFHLEVIRRVRRAVGPDFPLLVKYGVMDDREGGLTLSEGIAAAQEMVKAGIDGIEVSAGVGAPIQTLKEGERERAYFRERAAAVKHAVPVPVILVGGIRSLALAKEIVDSGDADMIAMSRPFIREPGLIARWQESEQTTALCISCSKCMGPGGQLVCQEERRLKQLA